MSSTLDDVARLAGVSPATVSRALRGLPRVSEVTRARVVQVADELGYVISPSGSRLASGRTHTVGVVVPYVNRWFFGQVITGVESVLRAAGFDLLLYNLGGDAGRDRFFAEMPLRRRVDAVMVLSLPIGDAEAEAFRALRVPIGLVGSAVEGFAGVRIDDVAGATAAMRHLTHLGHREIALISGGADVPMHFTPPIDRRGAYLDVLDSVGVEYTPDLEAAGDFTMAGGEQAMGELLGRSRRPTAVFAQSDEMAFGAMRTIRRAGLRVPEDISVVGFDDHDMADLLDLTTVRQPVVEQGATAATMLLDWLASGEPPAEPAKVLPTRLIVRGSSAPLAGDPETSRHHAPRPEA
ncbi:LacI family DNA-binding transcriptional regulator [Actinomadura rudentiformis]|uniref:LacI family transcriptional regulator n=1 Tax=Actinomadura rudentiformis TaxID=359158 RepID=A0A6H9Z542_9ACTN|nr:LacI family DNA-binding transcriptional regulator [Actinomadura rudentiformis]KAB2350092.1 LacI family transcriptional regulator [Actinomadura rudentiformis]